MNTRTRAAGAVTIGLIMLAAACGSGPGATEPDTGPVPVVHTPAELALPLDAYQIEPNEQLVVDRAAWRLTRACVERFGGSYTMPEPTTVPGALPFAHRHERRYGLLDPRVAATWGYNLPPHQKPITEDRVASWRPAPDELRLLGGPDPTVGSVPQPPPVDGDGRPLPDGGCQGETDRALLGGLRPPADINLVNQVSVTAGQRADGDSRLREAMARWSSCMRRRGHTYTSPWEPNDHPWPDPPGGAEIAVATADVACKVETNLAGVWMAVEDAHQRQVIEERAGELDEVRTFDRTVADNAARVLDAR